MKDKISDEGKRIEESAKYSAESQFEYAKTWRRLDRWLAGAAAVLAAIAGVGTLSDSIGSTGAGIIAIASAGIGAVAASLNAPQTKEKAANSANQFKSLQQDARIFHEIQLANMTDEEAESELLALKVRHQDLNGSAELPSNRSWRRARRQIEAGSQSYEVDE